MGQGSKCIKGDVTYITVKDYISEDTIIKKKSKKSQPVTIVNPELEALNKCLADALTQYNWDLEYNRHKADWRYQFSQTICRNKYHEAVCEKDGMHKWLFNRCISLPQ